MQRIQSDGPIPEALRGASVALGALDGVHLGHQAVIAAAREAANAKGVMVGATCFEPPPKLYFARDKAEPFRLASPTVRAALCAEVGLDALFELPFNDAVAALTAEQFARDILQTRLGVSHVTVGFDFQFGRDRTCDGAALTRYGELYGFGVTVVPALNDAGGLKVSSTRIREALKAGDIATANAMLGRPWRVDGVVEHGEQRGRTIGFPTANFGLGEQLHPRFGVYAVRADIGDGVWRPAVANFGRTPTTGLRAPLLETVLLDWSGDLYDTLLAVEFHAFLRPEMKFDGLAALTHQIAVDSEAARAVFA